APVPDGAMPGTATPMIVPFSLGKAGERDADASGFDCVGAIPGTATPSIVLSGCGPGAAGSGGRDGGRSAAGMPSIVRLSVPSPAIGADCTFCGGGGALPGEKTLCESGLTSGFFFSGSGSGAAVPP